MKRYLENKPLNVQWISSIPQHWKQLRAKSIFYTTKQLNDDNACDNVLSLTLKGVIRNTIEKPVGLSPKDYCTYQIFEKDDLVFKLIDLENISTSRVGIVPEHGIMSPAYIRFSQRGHENIRYLFYQYYDLYLRHVYNGLGAGVRATLSASELLNIPIVLPPREEQDQIVRYLDWQMSKINRLIAAKRKQIALISASKHAFASNLVTKGLDTSCTMRYSGVNWLGDIPKHWQISKLRTILHPASEKNHPDLPLLSVVREKGVIPRDVDDKESNHNYIPDDLSGYKVVRTHQFVINKMKAWQGSYGIAPCDGIVSPAYFVFNIDFDNLEYFHHAIRSKVYVNFFAQASDGIRVGQWDLSIDKMKDIPFILPPSDEQAAIVESIKKNNAQADTTISALEKQIAVLQELRTRLISDVVTGQVDVRGIKIPDDEYINNEITEEEFEEESENNEEE